MGVRERAAVQRHPELRHDARQAEVAQRQRRAGQLVDVIGERRLHGPLPDARAEPRDGVQQEPPLAERREWIVLRDRGRDHRRTITGVTWGSSPPGCRLPRAEDLPQVCGELLEHGVRLAADQRLAQPAQAARELEVGRRLHLGGGRGQLA